MNSRNSVIFDYPGRRLSLSILSLSLFDRNNFSNERAIYDRGEIVMGNQKETCVRARSKTHDGKYEISRRILITTFGYFDIHKGALVSIRNVRGRRYYPKREREEEKKKRKSIRDKTMTLKYGYTRKFSFHFTVFPRFRRWFQRWRHVTTSYYQSL